MICSQVPCKYSHPAHSPKLSTEGMFPRQAIHTRLANAYHAIVAHTCCYFVLGMHLGLQYMSMMLAMRSISQRCSTDCCQGIHAHSKFRLLASLFLSLPGHALGVVPCRCRYMFILHACRFPYWQVCNTTLPLITQLIHCRTRALPSVVQGKSRDQQMCQA